jgi:phosphoenolpyruvate carboxykinase (GTP)
MGSKAGARPPRIFYVNWFRKGADGTFLWPGFGDNARVLEWVFRRLEGKVGADETPVGLVPKKGDLDVDGLDISDEALTEVLSVDEDALRDELPQVKEHLAKFGDRLPQAIRSHFERLEERLG